MLLVGLPAIGAESAVDTSSGQVLPAPELKAAPTCETCGPSCCDDAAGPTHFAPTMFGDIIAILIGIKDGTSNTRAAPISVAYGAVKVAENESPLPQDRVFLTDNYYKNVLGVVDFHRQMLGFEKTFLDGDASFGMRLPFFEIDDGDSHRVKTDDLNFLFKYALLSDHETGSVLSTGLVVTAPTGAVFQTPSGKEKRIALIQPFLGYLWSDDRLYLHGFSSLVVPTESPAPTILFNDIGVGYWLYRSSGILHGIVPTFETHVNTPLSHRDAGDVLRRVDSVDLTLGTHFVLCNGSSAGVGVATPVTGPRLFDVELLAQVNFRF
jgi:hypothetical protein